MDNNQQNTAKARKGLLPIGATALGALVVGGLIGGGGTLALWNDSVQSESYNIESGNLEIAQSSEGLQIFNATPGGLAQGEQLDPENLLVVPGETYRVEQGFDIALEGHNLIGHIDTQELQSALTATAVNAAGDSIVEVTDVRITDGEGNVLDSPGSTYHFESADTTIETPGYTENQRHVAPAKLDGTAEFVVKYDVEFSDATTDREAQNEVIAALESVEVELKQQALWG